MPSDDGNLFGRQHLVLFPPQFVGLRDQSSYSSNRGGLLFPKPMEILGGFPSFWRCRKKTAEEVILGSH